MPKTGYKVITLKQKVFDLAAKQAKHQNRSISNHVSNLILHGESNNTKGEKC